MANLEENRKVLIVDDEKTISDSLTVIFRNHGYQARAAYSAEEAINVIAAWQPNFALLDVKLPNMNGIDLAIALKTSDPNCRVLLFSGYPDADDLLSAAKQAGHVFEVISKPVHPTVLLNAVDDSLSDTPGQPPVTLPEMN
jgi:DNA-binding NtrC family response regulator